MLNDAVGFEKIFIATGYTDLRRGIDGLASTIKFQFELDPFQKHVLFLFCGKRTDRIKGLVWEGDGFLLLYKRLNIGGFSWPRTKEEAMEIKPEQFQMLMQGLSIVAKHPIKELKDPPKTMQYCAIRRKFFSFFVRLKRSFTIKKIVIHNQNLTGTILGIKYMFDAMVVDNSHKYLRNLRYL